MTERILTELLAIRASFKESLDELDEIIAEGKLRLAGLAEIPYTDLGNGERIVAGEILYSAAWLNDDATAAKKWLDSRDAA